MLAKRIIPCLDVTGGRVVKGVKFQYTEFADDKEDPAVATSEARRLVEQVGVFAIVPDLSPVNPGPYLNQQHVPYVGFAFDGTYCSPKPTTQLYGFGTGIDNVLYNGYWAGLVTARSRMRRLTGGTRGSSST